MPLEPRAKRLLDMLGATGPVDPAALTLEARRQSFVTLMRFSSSSAPAPGACRVENRTASCTSAAIPVRLYIPRAVEDCTSAGLVYLHGGGLVAGSLETHDPLCAALAHHSGCRLISVDYRLAPEHRFPAALSDARESLIWTFEQAATLGIDPARIGIGGDSAGATLAALVCQSVRQDPKIRLGMQLLLCPIMDFAARTVSRTDFATGYLLDESLLARDLQDYLTPGVDATDSRVSPLRARELAGVPPTSLHTAEFDPLRDEGLAYVHRLRSAGVPVRYTCHPGMIHLFFAMAAVIPHARKAIDAIAADIAAGLGSPSCKSAAVP